MQKRPAHTSPPKKYTKEWYQVPVLYLMRDPVSLTLLDTNTLDPININININSN
jgi:hypothetical protein